MLFRSEVSSFASLSAVSAISSGTAVVTSVVVSCLLFVSAGLDASYFGKNFTLVDPNLYADLTVGGVSFPETVVDVCADGLKRNGTFVVVFGTSDFSAAETTGNGNLDTLCAHTHGALDGLLHSTTEGNTSFELVRDVFSYELSAHFNGLNFENAYVYGHACDSGDISLELVDTVALVTDNDTGLSAVNVNSDLTGVVAFDFDFRNASLEEGLLYVFSDFVILNEDIAELFIRSIPSGIPVFDYADTKAVRINFRSHLSTASSLLASHSDCDVACSL